MQRSKHNFHGNIEQIQTQDLPKITATINEAVEFSVFCILIFMIFYKFKNVLKVNTYRQTPENLEAPDNKNSKPIFAQKTKLS